MRIQCGYSKEEEAEEEEEEAEEEEAEEEEAEEEDCGVQRGYNEGTMYPYSLLFPKEEGKWIKIYV